METASLKHTGLPDRIRPGEGEAVSPCLDIEFDELEGLVRVYDPRLFRAARRDFCERLLEAAARQPGIHKAEIEFASASCQIEFSPGSNAPRSMADGFVRAVREASAGSSWIGRISRWRRRGRWSTLTAFRHQDGVSLWETVELEPARIRLRRPGISGSRSRLSLLADALAEIEGVEACYVSPWFHRITIDVCQDTPLPDHFLDDVEQALEIKRVGRQEPEPRTPVRATDADFVVAAGWKRLMYLGMAGGSFAMTLVALIVPGIPRDPFLLATSYCLARSSPELNERLRHTWFVGPILRDGENRGGLGRFSKAKLIVLALVIVGVSVVLKSLTPFALILIVLISSLSICGIASMPGPPEEGDASAWLNGRVPDSIPAG
jgi:uncharacterized membrane protein YbaN (DUF454 family)